jgi:hypothetical protein
MAFCVPSVYCFSMMSAIGLQLPPPPLPPSLLPPPPPPPPPHAATARIITTLHNARSFFIFGSPKQ